MAKINKYGLRELEAQFPNEDACLEYIFETVHSRKCSCGGEYKRIKGRKQYQCGKCRFQIAPTAGLIFHKSDTPLTVWFKALLLFSNAKSGYSAKKLERDLNVTYKTAWRMLKLIRQALGQDNSKLKGDVEMDETYFGGRFKSGEYNKLQKLAIADKSPIVGAVERGGRAKAKVSDNLNKWSLARFLDDYIEKTVSLYTDESNRYRNILNGYKRHTVRHGKQEYVRGKVHTNTIEGLWSHFKRSVSGTHKAISKKYLQAYLDSFVWHYNNRHNDRERFSSLLGALLAV